MSRCDPNSCTCKCLPNTKGRSRKCDVLSEFSVCFPKKGLLCLNSRACIVPICSVQLLSGLLMTSSQYICYKDLSESTKMKTTQSIVQRSWITVLPCTMKAAPLNLKENYDSFKSINSDSIFSYIFFAWMKIDTSKAVFDCSAIKWMRMAVQIMWSRKNLERNVWELWPLVSEQFETSLRSLLNL